MKTTIGVMGSSLAERPGLEIEQGLELVATRLGRAIASRQCALVTGATSGLPHAVSKAAKAGGGMTIGISPAMSEREHREHYNLPVDALDVVIYTGFGLKGRNVVNIRSSDIAIFIGGSIGTLNEFTIAFDEGKVIGVLERTGGISNHIREILEFCDKELISRILFSESPEDLVDICLAELKRLRGRES